MWRVLISGHVCFVQFRKSLLNEIQFVALEGNVFSGTFGEEKNSQVSEVKKFGLGCMNAKCFNQNFVD